MEIRYWIEIAVVVLILIVGIAIKLYTRKKTDEIRGFRGFYEQDENGNIVPVKPDNEKEDENGGTTSE